MTAGFFAVGALVAFLSCIQSIFGMGVLVFGTPTLLLCGFSFVETLCLLLPSSLAISALQVFRRDGAAPAVSRHLYWLCVPAIVVVLWLSVSSGLASYAKLLVGIVLLVSALARMIPAVSDRLAEGVRRRLAAYHLAMGVLHGATNLGGAMLAVLAVTLHSEKKAVRYTVAHYYLVFAAIQCATLALSGNGAGLLDGLLLAPVAAAVYLFVGNPMFARFDDGRYQLTMTGFIFAYGLALLGRVLV